MTILKPSSRRSAAARPLGIHFSALSRTTFIRLVLAVALSATALPAFSQHLPTSSLGADSADAPSMATRTTLLPDAMTLSDRALLLATNFNRLWSPSASQAPANVGVESVLQRALALLGTPYRWGGTSPDKGFDCSGLVSYVFRQAVGVELPRVSSDMANSGELVSDRAALNEGDLVFFGRRGRVDHVGIYLGQGNFVHAPSRGKDVMVSSLETGYWSGKFLSARRVSGI